jgi:hypothetical protein
LKILTGARKKVAAASLLIGLGMAASCVPTAPSKAPPRETTGRRGTEALTVFITGNTLGELKPCGCSGGQLGGFSRRAAILNSVPPDKRLVMDTGSLVRGDAKQDMIKFDISLQALSLLGYDVVNLTEKDVEISQNLGLLDNPILGLISPYAADSNVTARFQRRYLLNGKPVTIRVLTYDVKASPIEQIRDAFGDKNGENTIDILIVNRCDAAIVASIARIGLVDCVICPTVSDEPMIVSEPNKKPLILSVGRFGRYVCKLQIEGTPGKGKPVFAFQAIPVKEDLEQNASLINLYKDYQQIVKETNILEEHPRFALPGKLQYVGSKSCASCHAYEYEKWSEQAHAHAFETLEKVGSNFDPECVVCHVVGMDYESGFITQDKTPQLEGVGCENCHGPGSEHIMTAGLTKPTKPKSTCTDCHTPEHSGEYAGHEEAFRQKIVHWREPNAASHVK